MEGLEPPRIAPPDPKSGAAAITPHAPKIFVRPAKVGDLQEMAKSTFNFSKFVGYGICSSDAKIQSE